MDIATLTTFFMWCTIINGGLYAFTALWCICGRDFINNLQSKMFPLPRETFDVAIYAYLGLYKIVWITFNIVPSVALLMLG